MTLSSFRGFSEFFVFVTSVLAGISMIMGVNAVNSAPSFMLNYYQYIHRDAKVVPVHQSFWRSVLTFYTVVTQVTQMLMEPVNLTTFLQRFSLVFRLEAATVLMLTELVVVVTMPHTCRSETGAIVGLMIAGFIGGVGRAFFENTSYAFFGPFPPKYLAAVMVGVPLSGAIVSVLQIMLLAAMRDSYDSLLKVSIMYFAFSLGIVFIAGLCVMLLRFSSFARHYVAELRSQRSAWANIYTNVNKEPCELEALDADNHQHHPNYLEDSSKITGAVDGAVTPSKGVGSEAAVSEAQMPIEPTREENDEGEREGEVQTVPGFTSAEMLQKVKLWPIVKKIWPMMLACFTTFAVTCLIFPGLMLAVDQSDNWYMTLVVATYNFGDLSGRLLSMWKRLWPSRNVVFIASMARILFIPLMVLCAKHVIPSQTASYVITALMGITTGFFGTLSMVYSPESPGLSSDAERASAGQLTGVSLLIGCSVGSLLQMAIVLGL